MFGILSESETGICVWIQTSNSTLSRRKCYLFQFMQLAVWSGFRKPRLPLQDVNTEMICRTSTLDYGCFLGHYSWQWKFLYSSNPCGPIAYTQHLIHWWKLVLSLFLSEWHSPLSTEPFDKTWPISLLVPYGWVQTCNVTWYRNTVSCDSVDETRALVTYQKLITR
jgi:hypothetical protein